MREILFKAKSLDTKEWVEGYLYIRNDGVHEINFYNKEFNIERYTHEVDAETICPYTGLTDKNGNKIWENDIVKQSFYKILENEFESEEICGYELGVVVTIPTKGTCMKNPFQYVEVNGEVANDGKTKMYKGVCQYRCEVIGNIFDNPELLKGGA